MNAIGGQNVIINPAVVSIHVQHFLKECNKMSKTTKNVILFAIIATLIFGAWGTMRAVMWVQFETNCTQYLKRAADASSVETAKEQLERAISYAESQNLTEGVVSIFLHQPKNDIGYWYRNMTEAYTELENIPEDASQLEKTNVLMKLRETLTDETDSGTSVTIPKGISVYPSNVMYFWWGLISAIACIVLWGKALWDWTMA